MTPARRSPITRTLGIQLLVMSTVLALIVRIFMTASRPMPVIATSRNATTPMILARMEILASMGSLFVCWRGGASENGGSTKTSGAGIQQQSDWTVVNFDSA